MANKESITELIPLCVKLFSNALSSAFHPSKYTTSPFAGPCQVHAAPPSIKQNTSSRTILRLLIKPCANPQKLAKSWRNNRTGSRTIIITKLNIYPAPLLPHNPSLQGSDENSRNSLSPFLSSLLQPTIDHRESSETCSSWQPFSSWFICL